MSVLGWSIPIGQCWVHFWTSRWTDLERTGGSGSSTWVGERTVRKEACSYSLFAALLADTWAMLTLSCTQSQVKLTYLAELFLFLPTLSSLWFNLGHAQHAYDWAAAAGGEEVPPPNSSSALADCHWGHLPRQTNFPKGDRIQVYPRDGKLQSSKGQCS